MATWSRAAALVFALAASSGAPAQAHPRGFHKKIVLNAYRTRLEGLVVLDVDGAERTRGLRAAADKNGDKKLSQDELKELEQRLTTLALGSLRLTISGAPVPVAAKLTKLDVKGDFGVSDGGLSVAAMLMVRHPAPVSPGMTLLIQDKSPDLSPVTVQVFMARSVDAGTLDAQQGELEAGKAFAVRLGQLID